MRISPSAQPQAQLPFASAYHDQYTKGHGIIGVYTIVRIGVFDLPSYTQHVSALQSGRLALGGILSSSTAAPATEAIAEVMASVGIVTMVTTASVIPWKPKSVSG